MFIQFKLNNATNRRKLFAIFQIKTNGKLRGYTKGIYRTRSQQIEYTDENYLKDLLFTDSGKRINREKILFIFMGILQLFIVFLIILMDLRDDYSLAVGFLVLIFGVLTFVAVLYFPKPIQIYDYGIFLLNRSFVYFDEIAKISVNYVGGRDWDYLRIDTKDGERVIQDSKFIDDIDEIIRIFEERLAHIEILYTNYSLPPKKI